MTAVAVELLTRPPATDPAPEPDTTPALGPDDVEYVADTDRLMTMGGEMRRRGQDRPSPSGRRRQACRGTRTSPVA